MGCFPVISRNVKPGKGTEAHAQQGSFFKPVIQAKLSINQPNDIYEQEADAMADKVIRMPDPSLNDHIFFKPAPIQRKCSHCEEEEKQLQRKCVHCEEEEKVKRKESGNAINSADSSIENYISSLNGRGQSLPPDERNFFEPRIGYDFSNVKIHTGTDAAKSAQSISALAFTSR